MADPGKDFIMVAAIDFGTTYSGYAFSFTSASGDIKMNKNWGAAVNCQSYKTPTCVLTNPQGEFVAFGFEAEKQYGEIVETKEYGGDWNLYRNFKMILHQTKNISRETKIKAVNGSERVALDIFVMSLRYLKNHLLDKVAIQLEKAPNSKMIRWVLTVPAIWTDESKRFMREAAYKANLMDALDSDQLVIALEPEAASLHCRQLDSASFVGEPDKSTINFSPGTKYIVIDAGGGTIDVTVHQILSNGNVRELHTATGGAWGGTKIDENFIKLLQNALGLDFINKLQSERPQQWMSLMITFERIKRKALPDGGSSVNIPLEWGLSEFFTQVTGKSIDKVIKDVAGELDIGFSQGFLQLKPPAVKIIFEPVVMKTVEHLESLLGNRITHPCRFFFMVGGFSDCKYLQQRVMDRFAGRLDVLIPNEAQMAVVCGAVRFGHHPDNIHSRISRKTYGCDYAEIFNPRIHKKEKMQIIQGTPQCIDLLKVFVVQGEEVVIGTTKQLSFSPCHSDATGMGFKFFCMDSKPKDIQYLDEPGVQFLCEAEVRFSPVSSGIKRNVILEVTFGGTEIKIEAKDTLAGNVAKTTLDFLSH